MRHFQGIKGGVDTETSIQEIKEELADVIICADRVAEILEIDLGAAIVEKFNKTSEKHGFTVKI